MWGPQSQCFTWAGKGSNRTKGEYTRVCMQCVPETQAHETMVIFPMGKQ